MSEGRTSFFAAVAAVFFPASAFLAVTFFISAEVPVSVYQPKTYLDVHERSSLSYLHAIEKDRAQNGESQYDVEHCVAVCLCLHRNIGCGPLGISEDR